MYCKGSLPGICALHCRQYKSNEFFVVFSAGLPKFMSALNYERCVIHWNLIKHAKKLYNIMPDILELWAIWPYVVSLESCLQWIFCRFYPVNNSAFREISVLILEACFSIVVGEQRMTPGGKEFHRGSSFLALFEHINGMQCYELTRRYSPLYLMLPSPPTYAVYPWSVHCKCGMKKN